MPRRYVTHHLNRIRHLRNVDAGHGAETFCRLHLCVTLADGDYTNTSDRKNPDEFQTNWSATDDDGRIAGLDSCFFNPPQHARQRLHEGGIYKREMRRDLYDVLIDDSSGNQGVFCIGAVVENEVFAEVCFILQTE